MFDSASYSIGLPPKSAQCVVADRIGRKIGRTTFWEWRSQLKWIGPKYRYYSPLAVDALTVMGQHVTQGWTVEDAAQKAIDYLKGKANDSECR